MLFFPLIYVKMPTIVGILTFVSGENFMLNRVEHVKSLITSGTGVNQRIMSTGKYFLIKSYGSPKISI